MRIRFPKVPRRPSSTRRRLLFTGLAAAASPLIIPTHWLRSIVQSVLLPAHAKQLLPPPETGLQCMDGIKLNLLEIECDATLDQQYSFAVTFALDQGRLCYTLHLSRYPPAAIPGNMVVVEVIADADDNWLKASLFNAVYPFPGVQQQYLCGSDPEAAPPLTSEPGNQLPITVDAATYYAQLQLTPASSVAADVSLKVYPT